MVVDFGVPWHPLGSLRALRGAHQPGDIASFERAGLWPLLLAPTLPTIGTVETFSSHLMGLYRASFATTRGSSSRARVRDAPSA